MTDEPESGFNNLCFYWPYRLTVRTRPSQGLNRGSIPRRVTKYYEVICVIFKHAGSLFKKNRKPERDGARRGRKLF